MNTFEYLTDIISQVYRILPTDRHILIEDKPTTDAQGNLLPDHIINLKHIGINPDEIAIYRFDEEQFDNFLPIFRNGRGVVEGLRKFCDYIILALHNGDTYIIYVELKRGKTTDAEHQIEAAQSLMRYILDRADYVKDNKHGYPDFDKHAIRHRRLILKQQKKADKTTTRPHAYTTAEKAGIITYRHTQGTTLTLNHIL